MHRSQAIAERAMAITKKRQLSGVEFFQNPKTLLTENWKWEKAEKWAPKAALRLLHWPASSSSAMAAAVEGRSRRRTQLKGKAQKKRGQGAGAQGVTMCSAHHARCSRVRVEGPWAALPAPRGSLSVGVLLLLVLGADAKRAAPLSLALNSTHNLDARRRNKEESGGAPYYKFWQQSVALARESRALSPRAAGKAG
jgi:hypothetical protein